MHSFRKLYSIGGSDDFYTRHANEYKNPHQAIITKITSSLKFPLDTKFLDLGCGGGEVTMTLQSMGYTNIYGMDPYTSSLYEKNTGIIALQNSFQDVANNCLQDEQYDVVIASFSLHLCPSQYLKLTCINLALVSKYLVIISPHKNPVILDDYGWILKKSYTIDRVHTRVFKSILYFSSNSCKSTSCCSISFSIL